MDCRSVEPPRLYPQRWLMLCILSFLALLSDWICFSVAPIPRVVEEAYDQLHPAYLVTLFLTTNVMFCGIEPFIIQTKGLRFTVVSGSVLMFLGCLFRSGLPTIPSTSRPMIEVGTILVGAAQPFFQCTPAMLAANWFGPDERTLATTIAINANQIGIALSYMSGAYLVHEPTDIHNYFFILTSFSATLMFVSLALFKSAPPSPPSYSSEGKIQLSGSSTTAGMIVDMFHQTAKLMTTNGFDHALVGFVVSIGITNVISTFLDHMLSHSGFSQLMVGFIGAMFQVMIMGGSLLLGSYVDQTKRYFPVSMFCFGASFVCLVASSDGALQGTVLVVSILLVGFFIGPIQPITAEIAVEVTYPADENAIVAIQQVFGNLFSAGLVPMCNYLRHIHVSELRTRSDYLLLLFLCSAGGAYFSTFSAPLKRLMTETASAHSDKA